MPPIYCGSRKVRTDVAISGSTTFYDSTIDASAAPAAVTVSVATGSTQKVTHNLTLKGKTGQLSVLTHPSGASWTLDSSACFIHGVPPGSIISSPSRHGARPP